MRDISRIKEFTDEFAEIWADEFPDWRFGQLMNNFLTWLSSYKKTDDHTIVALTIMIAESNPEEKEMMELFKEYAGKGVDVANE